MLSYTWQASEIEIPLNCTDDTSRCQPVQQMCLWFMKRCIGESSVPGNTRPRVARIHLWFSFKLLDWPRDFQLSETLMSHFVKLYSCRPKCFPNNVQNPETSVILFRVTVCFIWLSSGRESEREEGSRWAWLTITWIKSWYITSSINTSAWITCDSFSLAVLVVCFHREIPTGRNNILCV